MPQCKAFGCFNNSGRKPKGVICHSVPKKPQDRDRATQWLIRCGIKTDDPKVFNDAVVCSEHFLESDYKPNRYEEYNIANAKKELRDTAVPSVFTHKLAKPAKVRQSSVQRAKRKVCADI